MNKNTEDIISEDKHIDKLSNHQALTIMLESHSEVISLIKNVINEIEYITEQILKKLQNSPKSRLIYVGAGTSGRIAMQDAVELYPTFGWSRDRVLVLLAGGLKSLTKSIENAEDNVKNSKLMIIRNKVCKEDIVIGLAASGNTPFTVECIAKARSLGALTVGIGNNLDGLLQKESELSLTLLTGEEVVSGSTRLKAGTAQKICLNMISTLIMTRLGFVNKGLMTNFIPSNKKLMKRQSKVLQLIKTS